MPHKTLTSKLSGVMICFRDERTNLIAMARLSLNEEAMLFVIGKHV